MQSHPESLWRRFLPVLTLGVLSIAACENDLDAIKKIANMNSGLAIDTTRGVDVIYSDSAIVKGRLLTPLLIKYATEKPYDVMPNGVKVVFFDKDGKEEGTIVADSAVQLENESITKFYKNVVATSVKGDTFKSDELIWDQPKKIIYSNKPVEIHTADGNVFNGVSFKSDDKLENPEIVSGTGAGYVSENAMQ